MGEVTAIAWTDHTFNPWIGCTKVSPGCTNCYAEARDQRFHDGKHWGKGAPRSRTTPSNWKQPLAWNREAAVAGVRKRVFCASLGDVFDAEVPREWRHDLWMLIGQCKHLDWQILTKRPENIVKMVPWTECETGYVCKAAALDGVICADDECDNANGVRGKPWPHVWIGTTVEDQERARLRIPWLLDAPAAKRFLSVEPQLGPVDLTDIEIVPIIDPNGPRVALDALRGHVKGPDDMLGVKIDWVIVGGESGHGARPFALDWARAIVEQCRAAGTACFVKQLGEVPVMDTAQWDRLASKPLLNASNVLRVSSDKVPLKFNHHKGGDPAEWPADLRVREFPR